MSRALSGIAVLAVLIGVAVLAACGMGTNGGSFKTATASGGSGSGSGGSGSSGEAGAGGGGTTAIKTLDASWISLSQLQLYFKLGEASAIQGTSMADSSGNGLAATLQTSDGAAVKTVAGKLDNALALDGVDDYVAVTDPGTASVLDFSGTDSLTITAWINPNSLNVTGLQILTKGGTAATNNVNYSLQTSDGAGAGANKFSFSFFDGATWSVYASTSSPLVTGAWQHVAFTFTFGSSATAKLYYNGSLVAGSWSGSPNNAPTQSNEALWIGGANAPAGAAVDTPFIGKLDEVTVWKRALSAAEIADIYNRP
jgi:hypothetical protein